MLFAILEISSVLVESSLFLFEKDGRAQRGGEEMFVLQYLRNKCHSTRRLDRTTFGPCRRSVVGGRRPCQEMPPGFSILALRFVLTTELLYVVSGIWWMTYYS